MKPFIKFALFLLFVPFFTFAQSNYKPGYVVTTKGDTLRGFIDYKEWDSNPEGISFKTTLADGKINRYTTGEISAFGVDRLDVFKRYEVKISLDVTEPNHIAEGKDTSFKTATVFLRLLQRGSRLSLYSYSDALKTRYYIQEATDPRPVELVYRIYTVLGAENPTAEDNSWLKTLFALAQKYGALDESIQFTIDHATYNKTDIEKIVKKINGGSRTEYDSNSGHRKSIIAVVGLAANATTFSYNNVNYSAAGGGNHTSILPALSAGIDVLANPKTGNLVFRIEAIIAENEYKYNYENKVEPYIPVTYSYNQLSAALSAQAMYNIYNSANFKFYLGVGGIINFTSYSNVIFQSQDGKTPGSAITIFPPNNYFESSAVQFMFKAGARFGKNWGVFADYQSGGNLSKIPYFYGTFSSVQAGLNYYFN